MPSIDVDRDVGHTNFALSDTWESFVSTIEMLLHSKPYELRVNHRLLRFPRTRLMHDIFTAYELGGDSDAKVEITPAPNPARDYALALDEEVRARNLVKIAKRRRKKAHAELQKFVPGATNVFI